MDAKTQEALLSDPRVTQSIKQAGNSALSDPEVQRQILEACKEKFPEYAGQAKDQVKAWAKDPAVQAKAKQYAGVVLDYAAKAGDHLLNQIEQGPAGVRVLAFLGSLASAINAVMSLINVFSVFGHMILYMVSVYQFIFSLTTMIFEAKPEWVQKIQQTCPALQVDSYQDLLMENARFLSLSGGRGMFYIFQGTLWLAFASWAEFLNFLIGAFLCFIGVLHVLMHYGIMPQSVAAKMRESYAAVSHRGASGSTGP